jgi:type II secretory ATPase GspE/PulE/Tfp pilus assembly ATPase PilB-like protein
MGEEIFPTGLTTCFGGSDNAFEGRTAITEFWKLGNHAADMIFDKNFSTMELSQIALLEDKMLPMAVTGIEKVITGVASLDNLLKGVGVESLRSHRHSIMTAYFGGQT